MRHENTRAAHAAVRGRVTDVAERRACIERQLRVVRDQAIRLMADSGAAEGLLQQLEALEAEREKLRREEPILAAALSLTTARVGELDLAERERRNRPRTLNGYILPAAGGWAGQ